MRTCKFGKLKHPVGRRRCKKPPRGRAARASYTYTPKQLGRSQRR